LLPAILNLPKNLLEAFRKPIQRFSKRKYLFTELQKDKIFNAKSPRRKEI